MGYTSTESSHGSKFYQRVFIKVAAGIAAFALRGPLKTEISKNMEKGQENYHKEGYDGVTTTWDLVQQSLHCCGVNSYTDWRNVTQLAGGVPDSCCKVGHEEGCGKAPVDAEKMFSEGCFTLFNDEFNSNLTIVGGKFWNRFQPS